MTYVLYITKGQMRGQGHRDSLCARRGAGWERGNVSLLRTLDNGLKIEGDHICYAWLRIATNSQQTYQLATYRRLAQPSK